MGPKLCIMLAWPWWHPKWLWVPVHLLQLPQEHQLGVPPAFLHCCGSAWGQDVS